MLNLENLAKQFTLHNQGGRCLRIFADLSLRLAAGRCVGLGGPSGIGKSTVLRMVYGNYACESGRILVNDGGRETDVASASPRRILDLRRHTIGYVSQFLRVVPRVPSLDVVAEPLRALGTEPDRARAEAAAMLERLNLPRALWSLSPTTFSGGEQQRVNLARGFVHAFPLLLLDEPTAALDARNREVVLELILEARARGAAVLGIFHDAEVRARLCDEVFDVSRFSCTEQAS